MEHETNKTLADAQYISGRDHNPSVGVLCDQMYTGTTWSLPALSVVLWTYQKVELVMTTLLF